MQRTMAIEAETDRNSRAKIISAEGEFMAAQMIKEASDILSSSKLAFDLKLLNELANVSSNQESILLFPVPLDFSMYNVRNVTPSLISPHFEIEESIEKSFESFESILNQNNSPNKRYEKSIFEILS